MLSDLLIEPLMHFVRTSDRLHVAYLYSSLVIASLLYAASRKEKASFKSWWQYCFPREIYFHESARLDYVYFIVNSILFAAILAPGIYQIFPLVADLVGALLTWLAGQPAAGTPSLPVLIAFTLATAIALDFGVFFSHYLHHKVPFLWQFHKVHHSAEVLTPVTVYRMHPVDDVITMAMSATCSASVYAIFKHAYPGGISPILVFGINFVPFLFYVFGYSLRHSHIWLSYGSVMSHILVSPAQHQIHHSYKPEHIDRNFGLIFAWWDWLFGSLYVPRDKENLLLGIDDGQKNFKSVRNLYLQPFLWGFRNKPALSIALMLALIALAAASLKTASQLISTPPPAPVTLDDLTFNEVAALLAKGYTTVIIPTGGTEQNGQHMILGKHNYVVRHTSEEIARKLGHTLVAPVINYVPEGSIDPPGGHMPFAGTLTIPEEVFAATLESAARSLKHHGFKLICFVGDSGWNQSSQQAVAEKLTAAWRDESTIVLAVSAYYFNSQLKSLASEGFSPAQTGTHAGIRDTSELLAVHPAGVRQNLLEHRNAPAPGVDGEFWHASEKIGRQMLDLKITAAVQQINETRRQMESPARP